MGDIAFDDITRNLPGGNNMGSLNALYLGRHKEVKTWPKEPTTEDTLEAAASLEGELTMKEGKRMVPFYFTDDTAELSVKEVGEIDGISIEVTITVFHPGMQKKILGFFSATKNEDLVAVPVDGEGQKYLVGSELRPVKRQASDGSGTGKETKSRKGVALSLVWKTNALRVYEGSVPLTPATSA